MNIVRRRLCFVVGLCIIVLCLIYTHICKTGVPQINTSQQKDVRFAADVATINKTDTNKPINVTTEELSEREKQKVIDSKAAILANYQALEILRTTVLSSSADAGGSGLAVLIQPPSELECMESAKFADQYYSSLSTLGAKALEAEVKKMADAFSLENENKYITMFISPPNENGVVNTTIQTSSVDVANEFIEKYRQNGSASYGKTTIQSGPEPAKDWRFAHIFRVGDADTSGTGVN